MMKEITFNKRSFKALFFLFFSLNIIFIQSIQGQFPIAEADKFINQGDNLFKTGNFQEAIDIYSNAIEVAPNYAMGYMKRAVVHRAKGEELLAEKDYTRAMSLNPYSEYIYDWRAKLKMLASDYIIFPGNRSNYFRIEEGLTQIYDGYIDTHFGIEDYSAFLNNSDYFNKVSDLEFRNFLISGMDALASGSYDNALSAFQNSIEINDEFAASYDLRGLALAGEGRIDEAIESFDTAIILNKSQPTSYYNRAMMYRITGKYKNSLDDLNAAISLDEKNKFFYFARAIVHTELGEYESALLDYDKILEIDSAFVDAYVYRGLTNILTGDILSAMSDINGALELFLENPWIWNLRGNIQMLFGKYNLAIEDYNMAIERDINYAKAYHNRGLALIMKLSKNEGCDNLRTAERMGYVESGSKIDFFCKK